MDKLKFITCSGVNEHTDIEQLIAFSQRFPMVEFGIQASSIKCKEGTPRHEWLMELKRKVDEKQVCINLGLHLNQSWVEGFVNCVPPSDLLEFLKMRAVDGGPFFQRIQLNFKIGRDRTPELPKLLHSIRAYSEPGRRFILSYNQANAAFIQKVYNEGVKFDCLFDDSFGEGIAPDARKAPAFADKEILQGYAGGLSPDNIATELDKIAAVVPDGQQFFVDAEGKLKNADGWVSLENCEKYVTNALQWQAQH